MPHERLSARFHFAQASINEEEMRKIIASLADRPTWRHVANVLPILVGDAELVVVR
jgi:hypothetical protein